MTTRNSFPATPTPATRPARSTVSNRFKARLDEAGVRRVRTLQDLMGHQNLETTLICADYAPSGQELAWAEAAFADDPAAPDEAPTEHD